MEKIKNPDNAGTQSGQVIQKDNELDNEPKQVTFVNFNDTTVLHIFQVLSDLLAEQEGLPKVKLTLKKKEAI